MSELESEYGLKHIPEQGWLWLITIEPKVSKQALIELRMAANDSLSR